jgi:hypothetical protein
MIGHRFPTIYFRETFLRTAVFMLGLGLFLIAAAHPGTLPFAGTLSGHSLLHNPAGFASISESDCFVDGTRYPRTADGINAALAACSPGTTHVTRGVYNNLTSSINIDCGQSLIFEGNPNMSFLLRGNAPAFIFNSSQCGTYANGVSGAAVINMQRTGGTVFKLCVGGYLGGVFGPTDGAILVSNQTGNTIDFGPCSSAYSIANFRVRNITSVTVPGDLIHIITDNYAGVRSPAPYIEAVTFSHIAALELSGRVIAIDANATGPETNLNALLFEHLFTTNSTRANAPPAPIYVQSSFASANSISFQVRDSIIGFPYAAGAITIVDSDGRPNTNNSILSVILEGVDTQGGTLPTIPFSSNVTANVPSTSDLQYRGATNATSFRPLYSQAFSSVMTNSARRGVVRLAPADSICWRNSGNTADLCIDQASSDRFVMPGPLLDTNLIKPKIGSGSGINSVYRASGLEPDIPFSSISAQDCQERKFNLSGAAVTGVAMASPAADLGGANLLWSASVSGPDTVAVRLCNPSTIAITPSQASWNIVVVQ